MKRLMENKNIKILAIDDNRDNLISIKAIISEVLPQSFVYTELSGQRGIETARYNDPDVILLDIVMPGMDGYHVCKKIKADEQLSEIPVIFLTALNGDKHSRILALEAGGEAFLAKPVDSTELKAQILAMLKIREAAKYKRDKRLQLEELVQKRTEELKNANTAALNLLEDLNTEKEKLKLLNHAVEASSVSVIITDALGHIHYVNPYFTEHTGYSSEEVFGKRLRMLNTGKLSVSDHEELWSAILSGKEWVGEYQNRKKNGELYWENAVISPILNSKGKVINFVAINEDITEKKKILEELLVAKEKAEESDRLKSAFLANMSHEIRTPMNGILGFASLLKEPKLSGEQQQKYIQIIEKSGARMLNIINDIVNISKIESGLMDVHLSEMNLNTQLQFVYDVLKLDADHKKLNLSFNCGFTGEEAIIQTDSEKFYGILFNLVKNAIKYTDSGAIEFGYNIVDTQGHASLRFYVKDTGIGIPKNRQEVIFERFIQADISDKMARQGAGLGLAISKAYVEMLGGKIWVESEVGKGSTFYFTLPYQAEPAPETICQQGDPLEQCNAIRKLKILMVEDDEVSEMLLDETVKMFGKEILKARTGVEAVEACRNNPDIDLILMDIQMPEMGGYEATRQIRQFNKEVVIIAQTAYGLTGDREKSIGAGCNDYIAKPITKIGLQALIHKYFRK